MNKTSDEWLKQADYDMKTAEYLFDGGRYFYAVFMCHLSIEKALKGLFYEKLKETPPKIHNLVYFIERLGIEIEKDIYTYMIQLNEASIFTRYPEDLGEISTVYSREIVENRLEMGKKVLQWIKTQF